MQTDLFHNPSSPCLKSSYPLEPGFKRTNTSKEAAGSMKASKATLQAAVLRKLEAGEFTADEVAEQLEQSILSIRPRFSELRTLGKIVDTGQRRQNESGRNGIVWRLA